MSPLRDKNTCRIPRSERSWLFTSVLYSARDILLKLFNSFQKILLFATIFSIDKWPTPSRYHVIICVAQLTLPPMFHGPWGHTAIIYLHQSKLGYTRVTNLSTMSIVYKQIQFLTQTNTEFYLKNSSGYNFSFHI